MSEQTLKLIIHDVIEDGNDVILLDLRAEDQSDLPEFSAGAHIDICADNGITRQYSLCNASHERHRYLVAVLLASPSRGCSAEGARLLWPCFLCASAAGGGREARV